MTNDQVQTMLQALRYETVAGESTTLETLVSVFMRLFPNDAPLEMTSFGKNDHDVAANPSGGGSLDIGLKDELLHIRTSLASLHARLESTKPNEKSHSQQESVPSSTFWQSRLRPTGRVRKRTMINIRNLRVNDIVLQISGDTCEVNRLY